MSFDVRCLPLQRTFIGNLSAFIKDRIKTVRRGKTMPKDIDQQIIDYLLTHTEFTTSDELSSELGVSSKTITRHVGSINKKFSKQIINAKRGQGCCE